MSVIDSYRSLDSFLKMEKAFEKELKEIGEHLDKVVMNQPEWFKQVIMHLVKAGGKRIRPLLVCLSYSLVSTEKTNHDVIVMAAISEFVHTATLFHDDVIDEGEERRGKPTVNKVYGNHTAVLGGDFILGKVFKELNELNNPAALTSMIITVEKLIDGEIWQMDIRKRNNITFEDYDRLIYLKTASLFEWCMEAGAYAANKDKETINRLKQIGFHIGRIFQIVDDILDYTGSNILGKKRLQDFYQGKITLPLLFIFEKDKTYFGKWKDLVNTNDEEGLKKLSKLFTDELKKPELQNEMKEYLQKDITGIRKLINEIPPSEYHLYINNLIDFLVSRMK